MAILLLINILSTSVLLGLYAVNSNAFIELLCVNKDKPEMNCDGKCSLAKILQQQEEDKTTQTVINLIQTNLFETDFFTHDFSTTYTTSEFQNNFEYVYNYFFNPIKEITYPPRVSAHLV